MTKPVEPIAPRRMSIKECDSLVGRIIWKDQRHYTVQGASSLGEVRVWSPTTNTLLVFDSRETFETWAYGKPVSANGESK